MIIKYFFYTSGNRYVDIYDSERILEGIFNHRITDAQDWSDIAEDVEFIMSNPNEYIYNADGSIYEGKWRIEPFGSKDYCMNIDLSADNVLNPPNAVLNRDYTHIWHNRYENKGIEIKISTIQMLVLIKKWRDFLLSEKIEEKGEVEIDFLEVVYYDRING